MARQDSLRFWITTNMLLWLGLMFAPVLLADEAWEPIEHPDFDLMFVLSHAPSSVYQNVFVEPVSVWYPGVSGDASAQRLRRHADAQIRTAVREFGMPLAEAPNPASMILRVQLIDLTHQPISSVDFERARRLHVPVRPGRVTLVAAFIDAASGRVVARIADLENATADREGVAFELERTLALWGEALAAGVAATAGPGLLAKADRGRGSSL